MRKDRFLVAAVLLGSIVFCSIANAGPTSAPRGISVSRETCTAAFLLRWRGYFRLPESDGHPGYKSCALGVDALCRHEHTNAIHLFKVAGSRGYAPAEYSVGIMYFRGAGVSVNRPLGAAWMTLAAARGVPQYTRTRDLMLELLTPGELAQVNQLRERLEPTYGAVALRRARWQRVQVTNMATGSHPDHPAAPLRSGITPMLSRYYRVMQETRARIRDWMASSTVAPWLGRSNNLAATVVRKPGSRHGRDRDGELFGSVQKIRRA